MMAVLARSRDSFTSAEGSVSSGIHQEKSGWIRTSNGASATSRSWRRGPPSAVSGPTVGRLSPALAVLAHSTARAMSRLTSPDLVCTCSPTNAFPSARTRAAAAIGNTLASTTVRSVGGSTSVSSTVAEGTNSRRAISSGSTDSPSKGLVTMTFVAPPSAP